MAIGFLHNRKGVRLTGDADVSDVLASKTFYKDSYREKKTGTLALTGDAIAANVLAGKKFYKDDAKTQITGTMPDNGTVSTDISAKATEVTIAAGKHSGSGKVKIATAEQNKIITGNIKAGVTILGVAGDTNVVDTSAGDAVAIDLSAGKKAYVDGALVTGTLPLLAGSTVSAGFCYIAYSLAQVSTKSLTMVKVKEIQVKKSGTYKVTYTTQGGAGGYWAYAQVYKNGSAYGTEAGYSDNQLHTISEDLTFSANDYVQIYARVSNELLSAMVSNFMIGISPASAQTHIAVTIS